MKRLKQYYNKFNKDLKMVHIPKKGLKNQRMEFRQTGQENSKVDFMIHLS